MDEVLTVDDVMRLAKLSRSAVLTACRRGDLPAKKYGNRVGYRIRRSDYEAWIATPTAFVPNKKAGTGE